MYDKQNQIFPCRFLDVPFPLRMFIWIITISMAVVLFVIGGHVCVYILGYVYVLMPFVWEYMMYGVRTKSYICLTADDEIVVKYWPGRLAKYPVSEIESIHVVDFDAGISDKLMKDYMLPISLGRGGEIVPKQGVLVFFKRKWFKSVRPVFFNPTNPAALSAALSDANKNQLLQIC